MFKKVLSYILIIFGLVELIASTSRPVMQFIFAKRDNTKWWGTYPCLHGDLVSMSYLDFVKEFQPPKLPPLPRPASSGRKNIALYIHGDSYIFHLPDSVFAGLASYYPIDRNHGLNYHLDPTKKNVLIIEISERYVRSYLGGLQIFDELCDSLIKKKNIAMLHHHYQYASVIPGFNIDDLFNRNINQNLQCNLFNYNFIIPMFEIKAALNYYVFNRASGDVVISDDRQFLFFKETVSRTDIGSSYSALYPGEISSLVSNLNKIYDHYRASGFNEVYLSLIPNSASIMQPASYNGLIPQIQTDPNLKMKVIDTYTPFRKTKEVVYLPGDTHWNNRGRVIWLDIINKDLTTLSSSE